MIPYKGICWTHDSPTGAPVAAAVATLPGAPATPGGLLFAKYVITK